MHLASRPDGLESGGIKGRGQGGVNPMVSPNSLAARVSAAHQPGPETLMPTLTGPAGARAGGV